MTDGSFEDRNRAIYWSIHSEGRPVAAVALAPEGDTSIQVSVSGDDARTEAVAKVVEGIIEPSSQPHKSGSFEEAAERRRGALVGAGFSVGQGTDPTVRINVEFDSRTGRAFTRSQDGAEDPVGVDILRNVRRAIQQSMRSGASTLTTTLDDRLGREDHAGAAEAVRDAHKSGVLGLGIDEATFDRMVRIDVVALPEPLSEAVRRIRLAFAGRFEREVEVEADVRALLARSDDADIVFALETFLGLVHVRKGLTESALAIWRKVARDAPEPGTRAWAWRNISMSLPTPSPEALMAAKASGDAFLEAGKAEEAVTSLMRVCDLLEFEGPATAVEQLQALGDLLHSPGPLGDVHRAALNHLRSQKLLGYRAYAAAFEAVTEAINLRRGLIGDEEALVGSLKLGVLAAEKVGESAQAETWRHEAAALLREIDSTHFELADRVMGLMESFDPSAATAVLKAASDSDDPDTQLTAEMAVVFNNPALDSDAKLEGLEGLEIRARALDVSQRVQTILAMAIVHLLRLMGQNDRALLRLHEILRVAPLSLDARDQAIDVMFECEAWGDAVLFLVAQCKLHAEDPNLLARLGEASLNAGDAARAAPALIKALRANWPSVPRAHLEGLRNTALERLSVVPEPARPTEPVHAVLREELEAALAAYSAFVSADKRSIFWDDMSSKACKWIMQPERQAQTLLHTFLKARFLTRLDAVEEVSAGAGRLDLLLKFSGGLGAVVELKMCGMGYSSTYASGGADQVEHYMINRACHLGYLVVHDARLEINGAPLLTEPVGPNLTIREVLIDVRPRVSLRSRPKA